MDFGSILDQWESTNQDGAASNEEYISHDTRRTARPSVKQLKKIIPQRTLDLHGYTVAEAQEIVYDFLAQAAEDRLIKVLIIHGKGYHSKDGKAVLPETVYACLDASPHAGARGVPDRRSGGSGAVWVAIK